MLFFQAFQHLKLPKFERKINIANKLKRALKVKNLPLFKTLKAVGGQSFFFTKLIQWLIYESSKYKLQPFFVELKNFI